MTAEIGFESGATNEPAELSTADSVTIFAYLPTDGDTATSETADFSGEFTLTLIDGSSGQIVAEKNVDVS